MTIAMHGRFPIINRLDDVAPYLHGQTDILPRERDGFVSLHYSVLNRDVMITGDPIVDAVRRECRGIKFRADTGEIAARPFHKFFNVNEVEETQSHALDWDSIIGLEVKMDGSMVYPVLTPSRQDFWFMTKAGFSDVAAMVRQHFDALPKVEKLGLHAFILSTLLDGITPIFEFTSPTNRIVVGYDAPQLTLLACREMRTGSYDVAHRYYDPLRVVRVVPHYQRGLADVRSESEIEGVVARWGDGYRVKLKAEWYVAAHRAKDGLAGIKNALRAVLENTTDDVLPFLDAQSRSKLENFAREVHQRLDDASRTNAADFQSWVTKMSAAGVPAQEWPKEMATRGPIHSFAPELQSAVFAATRDVTLGVSSKFKEALVQQALTTGTRSNKAASEISWMAGLNWDWNFFEEG